MNSQPMMNYYSEIYPSGTSFSQTPSNMGQYYEQSKLPSIYVPYQNQPSVVSNGGDYYYSNQQVMGQQMHQQPILQQYSQPQIQTHNPANSQQVQQMQRMISPMYYQPSVMSSQNMLHPYQYGHVPMVNTSHSPQQTRGCPVSPLSTNSNDMIPHNSPLRLDSKLDDKQNLPIDYSSLVSYTISPSLKRRRKSKQRIVDVNQSYPCNQCSKVFQKPYNLKSHMKTHSNEKPFKCSVCDKTFARSHDKKRHELLHAGEKNFKCEGFLKDGTTKWGCGKKFARSDALSRHFRTETGWLCIKPLMDEANESENNPTHSTHEQHQDDTFMDNATFIKKFIQPK
ncbi:uncharacterized protein AC631_03106 [Debaryomyces fabryi]|uniref:C2H2-type domain-containing protein n=1 Tax=Debaryomyces fabryi TaxID=58627 RepID=A0A0V1PY41_9ASCO|nr:uncharacterized protein AC631_03106 [Debaryomyces fabryi]KSA01165.1 hypothetical protein AC631_03106 [Debaryomyces fabryi]CUM46395.1 unnamed protein product [Debaryomyces fabryi]